MPASPGSPAQASVSKKRQSPRANTASHTKTPRSAVSQTLAPDSRRISIGSIVNPNAQAKDLVSANVIKYMSAHNVSNAAKVDSGASAVIVGRSSSPSNAFPLAGSSQQTGTGPIANNSAAPPTGAPGGFSSSVPTSVRGSSMPPSQAANVAVDQEEIGHGFIDINSKTAAIIEIVFGLIGAAAFGSLWIYMMFIANCYQDLFWEIIIKVFTFLGFLSCVVAIFHGCLDKRVSIGRGVFGCFVFFQLVLVAVANFVDAYMAINCICRCGIGIGAIAADQKEDLMIFYLSMVGSFSILAILVIASVTHD